MCRETVYRSLMKNAGDFRFVLAERDPAPWGADRVWERVGLDGGSWNRFLLCYDGRIVAIDFDWSPTSEQMAVVGEKLGG